MPSPDEIVIGSRWKWVTKPKPRFCEDRIGVPFVITGWAGTNSAVYYDYEDHQFGVQSIPRLLENAVLIGPPPCVPDCTPAKPCYSESCPGRREVTVAASYWSAMQWGMPASKVLEADWAPPELRCDRDMVCGLYRTT